MSCALIHGLPACMCSFTSKSLGSLLAFTAASKAFAKQFWYSDSPAKFPNITQKLYSAPGSMTSQGTFCGGYTDQLMGGIVFVRCDHALIRLQQARIDQMGDRPDLEMLLPQSES